MDYAQRINQCLDKVLSNQGSLTEAMRYSVLCGGKRFRPILTYTVADTFGVNLDWADSSACAVELIHAYSLIHDDLPAMDDDDIRHNQPACHKRFGEAQAILTGDGLQALAFEVLASDNQLSTVVRINMLQTLTQAAFEMAEGQSIDLGVVSKIIDVDTLKDMHQRKTGALLSCAVKMGALISGCSDEDSQALTHFAANIGLAYQIQDDVLDVLTPEEVLGKKQNSDAEKNKPTYPALLGLEASKAEYENLYQQAFNNLKLLSVNTEKLQALTQKLQSRRF
ncbi:(2E,6E)-farnesyl diphosphate synthase (EC 2.5.1.10) [uncultured Gammaproteobacteria bacterium]|jgi:farnesyl diphosphate synthase/geranylgeranyl diphosphate synthase type II|nr:(2E,6E)-farnesyl diphosphate synthase (EC [Bathymodiolus brooksi thiotrophic gill symbiont]CAC9562051.1 (2E,6E)-farnesyl diphosphate synthase (EC 2.5.1.10) [uncultured Gammaproteobacteria bacterium]CAC9571989.1 (2E,6E)-farnesyl diphosphate synthase (EC 2.5.1.10) [uncultured Gammaproteobacteria bacterium]CAC9583375.1 (2E,6E)-farnesyl diphosphate synthase (EC 2.5.1.10) [uncultured Gammaproteobacteria bacterium]CAC9606064.1 (2E,6E)-farnesyl diphosphate synthase (EC 2.5.1.10) [uncultured Gammapr